MSTKSRSSRIRELRRMDIFLRRKMYSELLSETNSENSRVDDDTDEESSYYHGYSYGRKPLSVDRRSKEKDDDVDWD